MPLLLHLIPCLRLSVVHCDRHVSCQDVDNLPLSQARFILFLLTSDLLNYISILHLLHSPNHRFGLNRYKRMWESSLYDETPTIFFLTSVQTTVRHLLCYHATSLPSHLFLDELPLLSCRSNDIRSCKGP